MTTISPYEYYADKLGVQARFLFYGERAHEQSLCLIGERGLCKRIEYNAIYKLRDGKGNQSYALLWWVSLPDSWKNLLVKSFGNPPERIYQSKFESLYERDMRAYDIFSSFRFPDNTTLPEDKIEEYTLNASVLNTIGKIYKKRREYRLHKTGEIDAPDIWRIITGESIRFRDKQPHTLPDDTSRLRQKYNGYKKEGYTSLISGKFKNSNARVVTDNNQTIYDIAVKYYGTVEAILEILSLNPDIRNDAKGSNADISDFHFDLPIAAGSRLIINEKSPMMKKNIIKELQKEQITTWQGQ